MLSLKDDARNDRFFIPEAELEQQGATFDRLVSGAVNESVKKVMWRMVVRTRDAFARGGELADSLSSSYARGLRTSIHASLEVLNKIERVGFDVWSQPITLSRFHRAQAWYQARFGRVSLR
jgi:phytoene/squalene synthetase